MTDVHAKDASLASPRDHVATVPVPIASTATATTPWWLDQWKNIAEATEASLTAVGIVLGAIWTYVLFVRNRQKFPRANVTQTITHFDVSPTRRLLHVAVRVENVGTTLVRLVSGHVRIQQLLPLPEDVLSDITCDRDPVSEGECEVNWPLVCERACPWEKVPREIEPSETDEFHFDFVVPTEATVVEVYTYLKNVTKRRRNVGWNVTSIYTCTHDKKENPSSAETSTSAEGQIGATDGHQQTGQRPTDIETGTSEDHSEHEGSSAIATEG